VEFFYLRSGREYVTMDSFTSYAFSVSIISLFTYIIEFSSPSTSSWNFTPFYVTMDSFTSYAFSVSIISLFTYIIEFSSPSTSSWNFTPFLTRGIHGERSLQYIH